MYLFLLFLFIYLLISQTQIYTIIENTSYKPKQKYVCRWPVENQNIFCRQTPLNIDIMSVIMINDVKKNIKDHRYFLYFLKNILFYLNLVHNRGSAIIFEKYHQDFFIACT